MKPHTWELETIDGGPPVGMCDFRICHACGASGGAIGLLMPPFYADGSGFKVSEDCDEAKVQIEAHRATWVPPKREMKPLVGEATVGPVTREVPDISDPELSKLGYELWGHKYDHLTPERMSEK
jgi:hypothetical protein